jgi:hypothetical protein
MIQHGMQVLLRIFILAPVVKASLLMLRSAIKRHFAPEWIGIWGFMLFLLPVGNLYFLYLQLNENDRFGFQPSAFLLSLPIPGTGLQMV